MPLDYVKAKSSKDTPIRYKVNNDLNIYLEKSSLDISIYTDIEPYRYYFDNWYILYNEKELVIVHIKNKDTNTNDEKICGVLESYKKFQRKDILNNFVHYQNNISKLQKSKKLQQYFTKQCQKISDEIHADLGFSLELPLMTNKGWYSGTFNEYFNSLFMFDHNRTIELILVTIEKDKLYTNYDYKVSISNKNIKSYIPSSKKAIELNENIYISYDDYINLFYLYEIKHEARIRNQRILELENLIGDKEIIEFSEEDSSDYSNDIWFNRVIRNKEELLYYQSDELIYMIPLKNTKRKILSHNKILVFESDIKTFISDETVKSDDTMPYDGFNRYTNFILLENGDLYVDIRDHYTSESAELKLLSKNVSFIKYYYDIDSHLIIIKTDKEIIYFPNDFRYRDRNVLQDEYHGNYHILKYQGRGLPFFIEKKETKNYTKYEYRKLVMFPEESTKLFFTFDEINTNEYLEFDYLNNKLYLEDSTLIFPEDTANLTRSKASFNANITINMFIKKGNYVIFTATNKKSYSIFIEKNKVYKNVHGVLDGVKSEGYNMYDQSSPFINEFKQYMKLSNLPDSIENNGKNKFTMIYKDYKVECDNYELKIIV